MSVRTEQASGVWAFDAQAAHTYPFCDPRRDIELRHDSERHPRILLVPETSGRRRPSNRSRRISTEAEMTCRDVDQFLMDYLAGVLPFGVRLSFTAHIALCSDCRRYIDTYRRTIALGRAAIVAAEPPPQVPEELVEAILASRDANPPRA
jgi:hypothetical protein